MKLPDYLCLVLLGVSVLGANWQGVSASRAKRPETFSTMQQAANIELDFDAMAERIISALKLRKGERVLIRFDPDYFGELVAPLQTLIRRAEALDSALQYPPIGRSQEAVSQRAQEFEHLLETADVYLWLPLRIGIREIPQAETMMLARWIEKGGARREIHFHWSQGSVLADGLAGQHSALLDQIYQSALEIDYEALSSSQDRVITLLRSGTVRVRTASGTDLSFKVGDRPFNKQNGDASPERMKSARVLIDREIELPAGVLRVAPIEKTVNGRIVIPSARFGDKIARNISLEIKAGVITTVRAAENLAAVEGALNAGGNAARRFREFALGFNSKLQQPPASEILPYFGYGAGVVRMSLGDNRELGGAVRGNFVRWFFFPDSTVEVNGRVVVRDGRLLNPR